MAASHMKHIHPVENSEQETGCPICPKTFTKIDHLKNHVWRHVNRVFPGTSKHNDMVTSTLGTYLQKYSSSFSCIPIIFHYLNSNFSNLLDLRNFQD